MPRQAGQIDRRKSEDILDAASHEFAENGLEAPLEAIARRAGVSKQTIYNHYGSKEDLLRALFARRSALLVEPLTDAAADQPLENRIADYLQRIMEAYIGLNGRSSLRTAVAATFNRPDLGVTMYSAGPGASRAHVLAFLKAEAAAGHLAIEDPEEAADVLSGVAANSMLLRVLLDAPVERRPEALAAKAQAFARRFIRAYAPEPSR